MTLLILSNLIQVTVAVMFGQRVWMIAAAAIGLKPVAEAYSQIGNIQRPKKQT